MSKRYCVYMHKFPNKKIYIGITCQRYTNRWNNGNGYKTQPRIYNAILKYGWDNIEHTILYENLTKEAAEEKEIELIKEHKSYDDNFGYNIEKGGRLNKEISIETRKLMVKNHKGMLGKHHNEIAKRKIGLAHKGKPIPEKIRKKISDSKKGKTSWNKGLKFSDKAKEKMSLAQKKKYANGYVNPMKGKHLTKEHKEKLSDAKKGIKLSEQTKMKMKSNNHNSKKVICLETKKIYNSGKECAEDIGCHRSNPNFVCNGRMKTCKGYHLMWLEDYENKCSESVSNLILG